MSTTPMGSLSEYLVPSCWKHGSSIRSVALLEEVCHGLGGNLRFQNTNSQCTCSMIRVCVCVGGGGGGALACSLLPLSLLHECGSRCNKLPAEGV